MSNSLPQQTGKSLTEKQQLLLRRQAARRSQAAKGQRQPESNICLRKTSNPLNKCRKKNPKQWSLYFRNTKESGTMVTWPLMEKNANGVKWVSPNAHLVTVYLCFPSFLLQAYFRQGVALQYLGRHADALAAFASGLAQDPKSLQLLVGMVEAAMKSPLRGKQFILLLRLILCKILCTKTMCALSLSIQVC